MNFGAKDGAVKKIDPVTEAFSSASRLTSLLATVLIIGTAIGVLTSAVVALLQNSSTVLIILASAAVVLVVVVFLRLLGSELANRSINDTVGTALVLDPALDRIVPPLRLRMAPRFVSGPFPFPIQSMITHKALQGIEFKQEFDRSYVEPLCTLLVAFGAKLSMMDEFIPTYSYLNRGPFLANRSGIVVPHKTWEVDEIAPSILDTGILRKAFPSLTFDLPVGITPSVSLSAQRQPLLRLHTPGVSLSLWTTGGVGGSTKLSAWKRGFPQRPNDFPIHGASFRIELTFGGRRLFGIRKQRSLSQLAFSQLLGWFDNVYEWMKIYLDWLDSDDEIPDDELFFLVDEFPPHYRYAKGAVPPGDGHIIFEME